MLFFSPLYSIEDHYSISAHQNALLFPFIISHPFLHPHPSPPWVMLYTHQCCRSLSCQIGLRWGSMYRHCRTNTGSRSKTLVSVIEKLSCHTSYNTLQWREKNLPEYGNNFSFCKLVILSFFIHMPYGNYIFVYLFVSVRVYFHIFSLP